ncbi:MAG: HmuY family protein [Bergeyella sp.]
MKYIKILFIIIVANAMQSCLPADEDPVSVLPVTGAVLAPEVGGATQPNQVWIDLTDPENPSANKRTDWDFGFYMGDDFRVIINGSVAMAVGEISGKTNIDDVKASDVTALKKKVVIGNFDPLNLQYVDNPNGLFLAQTTGIAPISENNDENPVYLVNMGYNIPSPDIVIAPNSAPLSGTSRGWKKIQILRNENGYKIKFANVDDTEHQEYIITKSTEHNFKFFSIENAKEVIIQPEKKKWDIAFTTFTNEVFAGTESAGSYFYADFVITNITDGVGAYQVNVPTGQNMDEFYASFKLSDVDASKFIFDDQRAIGSNWRQTAVPGGSAPHIEGNRFFIIKDPEGFMFKLRFNSMSDQETGERGHPEFEYEPL